MLTHSSIMAVAAGQATVDVVADFSRFGPQFQRDLDRALAAVTVDMSRISRQISDGIGTGVDQAGRDLNRLGDNARDTTDRIGSNAQRAGRTMSQAFIDAGTSMRDVGDKMTMTLTTPIVGFGTLAVKTAGDFEKAMNGVKAATDSSGQAFTDMRNEAIHLGVVTAYSATEAANGMQILASAGFKTNEIIAATPGVLDLASAGMVDISTAADIASSVLRAYGLQATDINKVNDELTKTVLATSINMTDLSEAFKYVGPVAKSAGVSLEEINAAIGMLGNAGIKGSQAGTTLKDAIVHLLKPSAEAQDTLHHLGVTATDSSGNLLSLTSIVDQLGRSGASTSDMIKIFGLIAGPGMMALVSQGSGALQTLTGEIANSGGTARRIAATQMEGFNGAVKNMKSSIDALSIAIGDSGLLGALTKMAGKLTSGINVLARLSPQVLSIVTIVGAAIAAIGPLLAIFGRMSIMVGEGILVLGKLWKAFSTLGTFLAWLTSTPMFAVVYAVIAIIAILVVAYEKCGTFRKLVDEAFTAIGRVAIQLWNEWIKPAFSALVSGVQQVGAFFIQLWHESQPVWVAIGEAVLKAWVIIRPIFGYLGGLLAQVGKAMVDLWNSSFKGPIMNIIAGIERLGAAIGSWWSENGAGAFQRAGAAITAFWDNAAGPALRFLIGLLKVVAQIVVWAFINVVIPAIKIAIEVIGEVALTVKTLYQTMAPAFQLIGHVVETVFNAIVVAVRWLGSTLGPVFASMGQAISSWWNANSGPIMATVKTVLHDVGAVMVWLWDTIGKRVFQGLREEIRDTGTIIKWLWDMGSLVFSTIGNALVTLWNVGGAAVKAIGAVFSWLWNVATTVFNAIRTAIGWVIAGAQAFWATFGPAIMAVANLLWSVWNLIFQVVFTSLKIAIGVVVGVFELWWHAVEIALHTIGGFFTWLWGLVQPFFSWLGGAMDRAGQLFMILWGFVSAYFTAIWGAFQQFLGIVGSVLSAVGGFFAWLWSFISPYFSWIGTALSAAGSMFSGLWNTVSSVFSAIGSWIAAKVGEIVSYASGFGSFVVNALSHFTSFVNSLQGKINSAADYVRGLPGRMMDALGNLGSLLWQAGQNVIQGLIDGISAKIGALRDKIASAAQTIRNALPFSPAKEGPLSGHGDPTIAGSKIVSMVQSGIEAQIPALQLTTHRMADAAHPATVTGTTRVSLGVPMTPLSATATASLRGAQRAAGAPQGGSTYNLTVNSLDPKTAGSVVIKAIADWERGNGKAWRQWH